MATTLEFQKRPALIVAGVIALGVLAFCFGRPVTHFLDRFVTVTERALPTGTFAVIEGEAGTYRGGSLTIGGKEMSNAGTDFMAFPLRFQANPAGQLVLSTGDKSFVLGPLESAERDETGVVVQRFAPGPGDEISFNLEHSAVSWPTPLEMNFMTGAQTASWKRAVYGRLRWKKPDGARLAMTWIYEQDYFALGGWREVWTRGGSGGLQRVEIQPGSTTLPK